MTTSTNALLVIDLQRGVLADDGTWDPDGVVQRTADLVNKARAAGTPVIWVQHNNQGLVAGEDPWQFAPGLSPAAEEPIVQKHYGDSFEETELAEVLTKRGVQNLIIAGAQSDACIRSTLHGAVVRGYDATLVSDCHTTGELPAEFTGGELISARTKINFTNSYAQWGMQYSGHGATTVTADEVSFG